MRRKLVESDLLECVLGLGPGLFYNSPMEACVVICRARKSPDRKGKILFINAVDEVAREKALSFLRAEHQERIQEAHRAFANEPGLSAVVTTEDVLARDASLSIPLYVRPDAAAVDKEQQDLSTLWASFEEEGSAFWSEMGELVQMLDGIEADGGSDV